MIWALWGRLCRREASVGDGLPADRRQGEGTQERVLRAFRVPARSGHSEFVDSLDLTLAEAEEWPEGSDPPPWAHERIEERWWSWVNSMTTRLPASEQVTRIRRIGRRWWRSSAVASRRSQPPGTCHTRAKRKAAELPNQVHREVHLDRRRFPVKLPADHFAAACSCGMVVMGATDEAREKWAAHLGRDVPTVGRIQRAARRVLARLRSWRDSARRPVDATARAVQIARETSPTDLIDAARLLADARHPLPHGPPSPYLFRDSSLIPVAAAASAVAATMVTITANTGSNNWNTNAAWVGSVQPTAADNVVIPSGATVTIPAAVTALCRSCTNQSGGALAFAATTSNLNIGDATAGTGNVAFSNAGTITLTAIGTINFVSTSATQQTVTTGGSTLPNVTFNGAGGSWKQNDALAMTSATCTLTAGTWATGSLSVTCSSFVSLSGTRTFTPGSSTITVTGVGTGLSVSGAGVLTITTNTCVFVMTGINGQAITNLLVNLQGGSVVVNVGSGATTMGISGATVANFVLIGSASKTGSATNTGNFTVTGTVAFQGNSATNRLLVQSNTLGTARTITCNGSTTASVTLAGTTYVSQWADFMDITGAGTASWDLTQAGAATATFGDCWGNSGGLSGAGTMTFTPAVSQTYTDSGVHSDNWSTLARWTSRVPLPQDNVSIPLGSTGTLTADMPRLGKNVDFTGYTGTWLNSGAVTTGFGNFTLTSTMTLAGGAGFILGGRSSQTITCAGKTLPSTTFSCPSGTYTCQDAYASASVAHAFGGFNANSFNVTVQQVASNFGGNTRSITMGTGTWTLTSTTTTTILDFGTASGITFSGASATIVISGAAPISRTFAGRGYTYGTLQYTVSGSPGPLVITGTTPTFANITVTTSGSAPKTLTLPASTTTTVTGVFTLTGTQVSGYVYLPGISGSYIGTPSAAWNQITGDCEFRSDLALDNWNPTVGNVIVGKGQALNTNLAYAFQVSSTGFLQLSWSTDGTVTNRQTAASSVKPSTVFSSGQRGMVRATLATSNPWTVNFYTSTDGGATWNALGVAQTGAAATSIFASTADVEIGGAYPAGTIAPLAGKVYSVQIRNGIGGTVVSNVDFTTTATGMESSYTDAQANVWTINGAVNSNVYLNSSTVAVAATVATAGATWGPNVVVKDITATPSKAVYDLDGTNVSGNTGIVFSPPDVTPQDRQPVRVAVGASIRSTRW